MSNNDNNNSRPEDNPFIAFRRFADSQVSSLLNTVFTLPATIANFNNAHQAREQCLFGKADKRQCDKLRELEAETNELRHEGRALFQAGDIRAVLRNSEELMKLDRRGDELRREILDAAASKDRGEMGGKNDIDLVERVANEKGLEWGGSWDWGFPKAYDHDSQASRTERKQKQAQRQLESMLQLQSNVEEMFIEGSYDAAMAAVMKAFYDGDIHTHTDLNKKAGNNASDEVSKYSTSRDSHADADEPRVWSWSRSWQWPPPADSSQAAYSPRVLEEDPEMKKAGVPWRKAYEDLLCAERHERPHCMRSDESGHRGRRGQFCHRNRRRSEDPEPHNEPKWTPQEALDANDEPSYEYSHDHEDQHDDPPTPKVDQRGSFPAFNVLKEEQDMMAGAEDQTKKYLEELERLEQRGKRLRLEALQEQDAEEHSRAWQAEQQGTDTELDVYEQVFAAKEQSATSSAHLNSGTVKPSILSTLTTTERTVAPDGSVTTKVILKKRFADGREESSETVHTERGQEDNARSQDPWKAFHNVEAPATAKESGKKSGWFWSS